MPAPQRLLPNLLLGLGVSLALLGALEGLARLFEDRPARPPVAEYIWNWDERWHGDFYTVSSDASGWPPHEEFNSDGLRDRAHPEQKPEGVARIAVLGDSVTLGAGLEPAQAYPQQMQSLLDKDGRPVEVLNVALWGWSTRQERIAYTAIARRYRPDVVLLAVCLNDIPELQNNLSRPPRLLAELHQRSALVRRLVNARGREIGTVEELLQRPDAPPVREAYERFFAELRSLRDAVRADGAALSLVVFPFRFQLSAAAPPPLAQQRIAAFCAAEGLRCLDLLPRLREAGETAFLDYDHLSQDGAEVVAAELLASGLVPLGRSARETLAAAGVAADEGSLRRALADADPETRRAAAWALRRRGGLAPASVERLAERLRSDASEGVRAEAARALGAGGDAARAARPALLAALGDPRQAVRWAAALALNALGVGDVAFVKPLVAALGSEDAYVRGFAAWTLGEIGPAAAEAVPALLASLEREGAYGRGGAVAALAKMGPYAAQAVPALLRALADPDPRARWNAARALGRIGPQAQPAVPGLTRALADEDASVRAHAARALGRIGPAAASAVPALKRAAADPERSVRKEARQALEALGRR